MGCPSRSSCGAPNSLKVRRVMFYDAHVARQAGVIAILTRRPCNLSSYSNGGGPVQGRRRQYPIKRRSNMSSMAVALPILPGKTAEWQKLIGDLTSQRRGELDGFHRRFGFTRANWYLNQTPGG